jgi:hypothetical protein
MTWALSRFRAGDLVEVRSKEEVLATLDQHGCVDGLPFMPEMLQYCGKRFRIGAVAHKTCETAHRTWKGRRLEAAVHLTGLRCDGSAHGGCQADCNIFWKDVWLKTVADHRRSSKDQARDGGRRQPSGCGEAQLFASTRIPTGDGDPTPRYSCQATRLYEATAPLAWWDPRQYVRDVLTRNHRVGHVLCVLWLAVLKHALTHTPRGYRIVRSFRELMHRWLTGREVPEVEGTIVFGTPTPTDRLGLKPGDRVRIRSKREIAQTLDQAGKNRGLSFDMEMSPYCGQVATVRCSVTRILDELTGRMRHMTQPCIILDGVVCGSQYSRCRLMCPRAIPSYWREIWLERLDSQPSGSDVPGGSSRDQ